MDDKLPAKNRNYNLRNIRALLIKGFSDEELRNLCFDIPDFKPVYHQLAQNSGKTEIVSRLLAHAEQTFQLDQLLVLAQEANPAGYEAHQPYFVDASVSDSPYLGMQYFDVNDADRFFGREHLTAKLVSYLQERRFLAVIGASGSGKSSVVRAGLIPALSREQPLADGTFPPEDSFRWPVHIIAPTAHPLEALATSLTRDSESVTATATLMDDLKTDARSLHLYAVKLLQRTAPKSTKLFLLVDQFEELFTLCRDETERRTFIDNLLTAAGLSSSGTNDGPTIVVITLRADFYHHCAQYNTLREALARYQEYIGPMSADELRQAIEHPAQRSGYEFEPSLVDLLLREVGDEPGTLPLLSHALLETWQRRRGRTLTFAGYHESGGVRGAIAKTAETVYNQRLTPAQQEIAKRVFLSVTELGEGTQDTRRRATQVELIPEPTEAPLVETVLKTLADARLVTTGEGTVEVAHEALIREWPTLRRWLDENRQSLQIHRQLAEDALEWDKNNRDEGYIYRGKRLTDVEKWVAEHANELTTLERAFIAASKQTRPFWADLSKRPPKTLKQLAFIYLILWLLILVFSFISFGINFGFAALELSWFSILAGAVGSLANIGYQLYRRERLKVEFDFPYMASILVQPFIGLALSMGIYLVTIVSLLLIDKFDWVTSAPLVGLMITASGFTGFYQRYVSSLVLPQINTAEEANRDDLIETAGTISFADEPARDYLHPAKSLSPRVLIGGGVVYAVIWLIVLIGAFIFGAIIFAKEMNNISSSLAGQSGGLEVLFGAWSPMLAGGMGGTISILWYLYHWKRMGQLVERSYILAILVQPIIGLFFGLIIYLALGILLTTRSSDTLFSPTTMVILFILSGLAGFRQQFVGRQLAGIEEVEEIYQGNHHSPALIGGKGDGLEWGLFIFIYALIWLIVFIGALIFTGNINNDIQSLAGQSGGLAAASSAWYSMLIGGVAGAIYILFSLCHWGTLKRSVDFYDVMSILVLPILGLFFGLITHLAVISAFLTFNVAGAVSINTVMISLLLSGIAGFRQQRIGLWVFGAKGITDTNFGEVSMAKQETGVVNSRKLQRKSSLLALLTFGYAVIWLIVFIAGIVFTGNINSAIQNLSGQSGALAAMDAAWYSALYGGIGSITSILFGLYQKGKIKELFNYSDFLIALTQPINGFFLAAVAHLTITIFFLTFNASGATSQFTVILQVIVGWLVGLRQWQVGIRLARIEAVGKAYLDRRLSAVTPSNAAISKWNLQSGQVGWSLFIFVYGLIWLIVFIGAIIFVGNLAIFVQPLVSQSDIWRIMVGAIWYSALWGGIGSVVSSLFSLYGVRETRRKSTFQSIRFSLLQPILGFLFGAASHFVVVVVFLFLFDTSAVFSQMFVIMQLVVAWLAGLLQRFVWPFGAMSGAPLPSEKTILTPQSAN
ncbi:MAG: hypothetical protein KJ077_36590 [Anaerolineae bacterium]|nr:hypothetical protein [Anaerolineae bacterium]